MRVICKYKVLYDIWVCIFSIRYYKLAMLYDIWANNFSIKYLKKSCNREPIVSYGLCTESCETLSFLKKSDFRILQSNTPELIDSMVRMFVSLFLNTDLCIYFLSQLCDPAPHVICGQGYILFTWVDPMSSFLWCQQGSLEMNLFPSLFSRQAFSDAINKFASLLGTLSKYTLFM